MALLVPLLLLPLLQPYYSEASFDCHPSKELCQDNTTCLSFLQTECEDHKVLDLSLSKGGPQLEASLKANTLSLRIYGAEIPGSYQLDLSRNSSSCSSFILTNVHTPSVEVDCSWTNESQQVAVVAFADALARSYLIHLPLLDKVHKGCTNWNLELVALVSGSEILANFPQPDLSAADTYRISLVQRRAAVHSAVTSVHSGEVTARFAGVLSGNYSLAVQPLSNSTSCRILTTRPFSVGTPKLGSRIPMVKIVGVIALGVILVILFVLAWVLIRMFGKPTVKTKPKVVLVFRPVSEEYSQVVTRLADYLKVNCYLEVSTEEWDSFQGHSEDTVIALLPHKGGGELPDWLSQERVILATFKPGSPSPCPPKLVMLLLEDLPRLLAVVHNCQPMFSWLKVYPRMPGYNYLDNIDGFSLHHTINKLAHHTTKVGEEIPLSATPKS